MLLAFVLLLTHISNSSQFGMYSRLSSRLGGKGLNLLLQQRSIRILNPHLVKVAKSTLPLQRSTALPSSASDDNDNDDEPNSSGTDKPNSKEAFMTALLTSLRSKDMQKLVLSENKQIAHDGSSIQHLKSVTGRLIEIKAGLRLQLVYRYITNDKTKNLPLDEVDEAVRDLLASGFKKATVSTAKETQELSLKRGSGKLRIIASASQEEESVAPVNLQHDRKKNIPVDAHAPFLKALKVTTDGGRPLAGMADKFRQIQKFVEILGGLVERSDVISQRVSTTISENFQQSTSSVSRSDIANIRITDKLTRKTPLKVVDMGSGMAYLTFSAHSHLLQKFDLDTIGVEARDNLVLETNNIAGRLGPEFNGLRFVKGDILDYFGLDLPGRRAERGVVGESKTDRDSGGGGEGGDVEGDEKWNDTVKKIDKTVKRSSLKSRVESNKMDVLIALHACDTATDDAIWCGIQGGAQIIVTAPCCHKQVRGQLDRHIATSPASDISGSGTGGNGLTELLQHGIYRERESEMVTDSIRALLLEWCGYTTTVFEFVGGEHTAKNVMIAAVKRTRADVGVSEDNLVRARQVLAGIQAQDKAKKEKKKKFKSVSVNSFGDVDVDSYAEVPDTEEETERKVMEIADMAETNSRVERMAEVEKEDAIARRIDTLMKTFGVKNMKLFDLVFGDDLRKKEIEENGEEKDEKKSKSLKLRKFRK